MRNQLSWSFLFILGILIVLVFSIQVSSGTATAVSENIRPIANHEQLLTNDQWQAQELALQDKRLASFTTGKRAELFSVRPIDAKAVPAELPQCADGSCYQANIYIFDTNVTVMVIVHINSGTVLEVLNVPDSHPAVNNRYYDLAVDIIRNDADVEAALGFEPQPNQIRLMEANHMGTDCNGRNLCAATVFYTDSGAVWVLVDLTTEQIAKIWWTERDLDARASTYEPQSVPDDCNVTKSTSRDGWTLDYLTTATDGLDVRNVSYQTEAVATSIKVLEWHVHYLDYPYRDGFVDFTGCGFGSFRIPPFGDTQVLDLYDGLDYIGFEVVQDFRMSNWGAKCNYRYEQRFQFFTDGRWRTVVGAYGQGCDTPSTYRPVLRIDIAVDGDAADSLAVWDGGAWVAQTDEGWWLQDTPYTTEGYRYRVLDTGGAGYFIEPGQGQFGDGGTGDNAYFYATQYKLAEGGVDMGPLGVCCNVDEQQGPDDYINSESIDDENIVLWYSSQSDTIATSALQQAGLDQGASQYCWTDDTSNTWPCFTGPMFVPVCSAVTAVAPTPEIAPDNTNVQLTWNDDPANKGGYEVWRSTDPTFIPGDAGSEMIYAGSGSSHPDPGALGDPNSNYFYIIRAKNCTSTLNADSVRVGEYDFAIEEGTP